MITILQASKLESKLRYRPVQVAEEVDLLDAGLLHKPQSHRFSSTVWLQPSVLTVDLMIIVFISSGVAQVESSFEVLRP